MQNVKEWCPDCNNHLEFLSLRNDNQSISNHGVSLQWKGLKSSGERILTITLGRKGKNVFWLFLSYIVFCFNWLLDS